MAEWAEQGTLAVGSGMLWKAPGGEEARGLGGRAHTLELVLRALSAALGQLVTLSAD